MRAQLHSEPWTLQQAPTDPRFCQRLLDIHRRAWLSLLWGHCSFLLGPGMHKVLFVPSKHLFPQSCVSSGSSMMGQMVTSSKRAHATGSVRPRSAAPRVSALQQVTADLYLHWRRTNTQSQVWLCLCGFSRSWCAQGFV